MAPQKFTHPQRYAIWFHHEKRCWRCLEDLDLRHVDIDHVIPQSLLSNESKLNRVLIAHDLPAGFDIQGYENLLPVHPHCNRKKSDRVEVTPYVREILDDLLRTAKAVESTVRQVERRARSGTLLGSLASAIEAGTLSETELSDFLAFFGLAPVARPDHEEAANAFLRLDNGYWVKRDDIISEGFCRCERQACVERETKVYCFFTNALSEWIIRTGLFHRCYDEIVVCHRCLESHKRGYIGRDGSCGCPYSDQVCQVDTRRSRYPSPD